MPANAGNGWSIAKSWAITPPTGTSYDAAYIVRLAHDDGSSRELIVEFEAPSAVASVGYAEEIARRFVRTAEPPRHVIVDRQREVSVLNETSGD